MAPKRRNRSRNHHGSTQPLADLARHHAGDALIGGSGHQRQRLPDALSREDAQERRLLELNRQRLLKRAVEHRFAGGVHEIGDEHRVAVGEHRHTPPIEQGDRRRENARREHPPSPCAGRRRALCRRGTRGLDVGRCRDSRARRVRRRACGAGVAADALQIRPKIGRALVAEGPILFERLRDDPFEIVGNLGIEADRCGWLAIENRVENHSRGVAGERPTTRAHFVEHDAEGEDVTPRVERLAADLLGRHIGDGAHGRPRTGQMLVRRGHRRHGCRSGGRRRQRELREPEVQNLGVAP